MEYKGYTIKTEWESPSDCTYRIYDGEKLMRTGGYFDHEYDAIEQAKLDIDYYPKKYTPENRPPYPWVKVEDRLPKKYIFDYSEHCLIAVKSKQHNYRWVLYGFYDLEKKIWYFDNESEPFRGYWHVTHWQYLPALPEKEQKPEDENKTTDFEWEWWYD